LRTGTFIAFEGIDGSGKSTAMRVVAERLRERGLDVVATREPGGTPPGRQIRALLLDADHALTPATELLLMCADRAEHVATVIRPALQAGKIVLCDRYAGSTRAYQGYGLGLDMRTVDAAIAIATGGLSPDLTILFDLEPSAAHARRSGDAGSLNQLDVRDLAFRTRVRDGFLALAGSSSDWRIIDASQSTERVADMALELIDPIVAGQRVVQ
jgi:dTMP kinase